MSCGRHAGTDGKRVIGFGRRGRGEATYRGRQWRR